jgi:hypothetical protein
MTAEEQIEEILHEASSYGLRIEVMESARSFIEEGYDKVTAYELAYREWIK